MVIIGITGSIGTGKSTIARLLKDKGAYVLNADQIAHQLLDSKTACFKGIVKAFGKEILAERQIDRKKLAAIIFTDGDAKKKLEAIIHPRVIRKIKSEIKRIKRQEESEVVVLDVPLLFETGLDKAADHNIVVTAKRNVQIERAAEHLHLSKAEVNRRIRNQWSLRDKVALADEVIDNSGSINQTKKQVNRLWQKILKMKKQ